jgi:S1-C subfamily serine protease
VVGINTAMIGRAQNLCFAVSSNTALFVLSEIIAHGRVRRAHLGIAVQTIPVSRRSAVALGVGPTALRITEVQPDSPAHRSNLKPADLILSLDGRSVVGADDLVRFLTSDMIGREIEMIVLRDQRRELVQISPSERRAQSRA